MVTALSISKVKNIYENCISAKVSSKNAFDLQIIECLPTITEMEKEDDFGVASSAIDASTVIYSKRIDSLYNQTNDLCSRIALGKFNEDPSVATDPNSDQAETNSDPDSQPKKQRKKVKRKIVKTIEIKMIETRIKNGKNLAKSKFMPQAQIDMAQADANLTGICKLNKNLSFQAGFFLKNEDGNESVNDKNNQ